MMLILEILSWGLVALIASMFFGLAVGAFIRAGRGDDGHLSSDDYWRDVQ